MCFSEQKDEIKYCDNKKKMVTKSQIFISCLERRLKNKSLSSKQNFSRQDQKGRVDNISFLSLKREVIHFLAMHQICNILLQAKMESKSFLRFIGNHN